MKRLLFILCLTLFSCSTDDSSEEENVKNTVAIGTHCQSIDPQIYLVSNGTMTQIKTHEICDEVSFTDLEGEEVTGILLAFGSSND